MNSHDTSTVALVDHVAVPRSTANAIVDSVTIAVEQYKAVAFDDCIRLLGPERFAMLQADPIRRFGPRAGTVYPWNVVDYLSCKALTPTPGKAA